MRRVASAMSRTRSATVVAVVAVWVLLAGTAFVGVASAAGSVGGVMTPCSAASLQVSASTNLQTYGPGTNVVMVMSARNTSTSACSLTIGPTSPSLTITNSSGAQIWNNCFAEDQMGACPQYVMLFHLAAGAVYSKSAVWDQGIGGPASRGPSGAYVFTARLLGAAAVAVPFTLGAANSVRTVLVTQINSAQSYTLAVGEHVLVRLAGASPLRWTLPRSSNARVLRLAGGTSGTTATAIFVAAARGEVTVTAVATPHCSPQCTMPSRLFEFKVDVAA